MVPGLDGNEPEDDGVEFASSGEAEHAPRDTANLDNNLSDEMLEDIRAADTTAREAENLAVRENFVVSETGREMVGSGAGTGREEANFGSNPGFPASTPAISVQTPGHVGSIPAERVNGDARLIRDRGTSRQPAGHFCSNPAERECEALDDEIACLENAVKALHQ